MPRLSKLGITLQACRSILWLAGRIVPKELRADWLDMWQSKAWHWANFLAETNRLNAFNQRALLRACWRSFPEALWLRYDRDKFLGDKRRILRSPATCLGAVSLLFALLLLVGGFVPPRSSLFSKSVSIPDRVAIVAFKGKYVRIRSETLLYLGGVWKSAPAAAQLALYSWEPSLFSDDWS
jgi:hypothetical protein